MILFLYGEDTFRSHQKLLQLKEQFLDKYGEAERYEFDMEENESFSDIENAVRGGGFFAAKKLVIIKRIFSSSKDQQQRMVEVCESVEGLYKDVDAVVIFWDVKVDKRNKLFSLLKKQAKKIEEFAHLREAELFRWIDTELQSMQPTVQIETRAKRLLIERVGVNSGCIHMELEKLSNFVVAENRESIEEEDIAKLVSEKVQGIIFEALDALGAGNKRRAFNLLHAQLEKGENPIYLFTMYAYQVRNLLVVASCREDGMGDARAIASQAKMAPFVVQKLLSQANAFSVLQLKRSLQQLARYDIAMKSGKIEPELALEEFILKS